MAENKKSFLLYTDVYHTVKKLDDIKAGQLFKHILSYVNDENPTTDDFILEIAFEPIKQSLKRDLKRYESICLRNKENGSKGGRPKTEPKKPIGLSRNPKNPTEPKKADSDSDSDNDNDNVIEEYWRRWKQYKKDEFKFNYKSLVSEDAAKKELLNLAGNDRDTVIKIIEQSIANGWKGFFKLKINGNGFNGKSVGASNEAVARIIAERFGTDSTHK
jgi:hypothetical protein